MTDPREIEFKVTPRIRRSFEPVFSNKDPERALLILTSISEIEGQEIEWRIGGLFFTFELVDICREQVGKIKTLTFLKTDSRLEQIGIKIDGCNNNFHEYIGKRFSARLIKTWCYKGHGSDVVGIDDDGTEVEELLYAIEEDWIIDIDTLQMCDYQHKAIG